MLKRRGKVWHYAFTLDGERYRGTTGETDKERAAEVAEGIKARQRSILAGNVREVITFAECVQIYIKDDGEQRFLAPLLHHFRKHLVKDISGLDVRNAARTLYPDASPATWNRQVITPMRAVINKAAEAGLCNTIKVKRFPEERPERPAATREWIDAFCDAALKLDMPETAAIVRFMFETGARVSEACRLEWKDVSIKGGRAFLERTKTEPRTVFFTNRTAEYLVRLQRVGPVFNAANRSTVRKRIARVLAKANLTPLTSHEFGRHGFYTEMIKRNGIDAKTASKLGGSKSVRLVMETYVASEADRTIIDRVFGQKRKRK